MTMYTPTLDDNLPRYQALADAIARDLAAGLLAPGDRLPPQRDLADALGVTVGTVSRGYAEAERRGLTYGEVGRGTYVRGRATTWPDEVRDAGLVDFSLSLPVAVPEDQQALADTLRELAGDARLGDLLLYQSESAGRAQRGAVATWLGRMGLSVGAEDVLVTAGSQHGLNVVLTALLMPGQVLLTEELTYPSIKSQARAHGIRLRGVALDDEGLCPESLARACHVEPRPTALYLVPTIQNPTTGTLSEARRRAIADVAAAHDLWIIEDDVHGFLLPEPPTPLACLVPERTVYLSSVAKCLVPGLRTGFLAAPQSLHGRLLAGIHTSMWMPPPLMVEVTARWLADGTADRLMAAKRREMQQRRASAADFLARHQVRSHPHGYQFWLTLPEPWHTDEFTARARARGVVVVGAGAFAVSRRGIPHAVRLSIGQTSRAGLARGLGILDELLSGATSPAY